MINISIDTKKDKKDKISIGSLTATDWLNNIPENKIVIKGKKKNIISPTKLLSTLRSKNYIHKLSNKKGYIPNEKYYKKGFFEVKTFDVLDENNKIKKTTYTILFTRKGQKKLLKIVLNLIKEKESKYRHRE